VGFLGGFLGGFFGRVFLGGFFLVWGFYCQPWRQVGRNLQDHLVTHVSVSLTAAASAALNFWDILSPRSHYELGNLFLFHLQKIILTSVADSDPGSGAFF
jgi:hypothetical protein